MSTFNCQSERRREEVREHRLFGLDYLEVSEDEQSLTVYFLGSAPESLSKDNICIEGGRRIRDIAVVSDPEITHIDDDEIDDFMMVRVDRAGDFSSYTLRVEGIENFDKRFSSIDFSFKAGCSSDLDCKMEPICPPPGPDKGPHQLSRERLHQLPPDDSRPPRGNHARMEGIARPRYRTGVSRSARVYRRPPQLLSGRGCHRSLSGDRASAYLSRPARATGGLLHARGVQCARVGACRYRWRNQTHQGRCLFHHTASRSTPGRSRHTRCGGCTRPRYDTVRGVPVHGGRGHGLRGEQPASLIHLG